MHIPPRIDDKDNSETAFKVTEKTLQSRYSGSHRTVSTYTLSQFLVHQSRDTGHVRYVHGDMPRLTRGDWSIIKASTDYSALFYACIT